jgi:hypothetical protein
MDYAKDGRGKLITAWEAVSGLYYRCPEPKCRAEVFLKRGKKNIAHFAHWPGQGRPECELYHPSNYLAGPSPRYGTSVNDDIPTISPLSLSIELDPTPESRLKGKRDWKLALTVPKAPDTHGAIRIDCGIGTPRLIALSKLARNSQTYPASLAAEDFAATWTSPEVHPKYKAAVEHRISGLDQIRPNLFANGKQKQKPLAKALSWGGSYYLVWRNSNPMKIPVSLASLELAERDGWSCSIISLPDDEDIDTRRWIEAVCDLTIGSSRRQWSLVYPPVVDIDSLGNLIVESNRELLIATAAPPRQDDWEDGQLVATLGRSAASVATKPGRQFFAIEHDAKSDGALAIVWDGLPLQEIAQGAAQRPLSLFGAAFSFRSRLGAERYRCFLHQAQIEPLFEGVRRSELDIYSIALPAGCGGVFNWRKTIADAWQSTPLLIERGAAQREIEEDVVEHINLVFHDASFEILLSFGALGSRHLTAQELRIQGLREVRLPYAVRERLLWFCVVAKSHPREAQLKALTDEALVHHYKRSPTPPFLIAHRRHLDGLVRLASGPSEAA